ncbi:uncharacterized protein STEHIDRAFT_120251 [Stereum hirsutum FP-91666 SS1]|uniref:uncharacterized protein n=1 Tax=Stereum hirsutum (strain FP-91666) TaxID=721885 RepID=UPI000440BBBE|nr:uncharacterized protein STEHIDRAFT_120251 [Stereum hirsutum FP-91666 SS1]EIM88040.1 hypothetical protein STEHIDRAFT_120251 [Stereum hirsutum FP-91666 SS1]
MERAPLRDLPLEPFVEPTIEGFSTQLDDPKLRLSIKRPLSPDGMKFSPDKRRILAQAGVMVTPKSKKSSFGHPSSSTRHTGTYSVRHTPFLASLDRSRGSTSNVARKLDFGVAPSIATVLNSDMNNQAKDDTFTACSTPVSPVATSPSRPSISAPVPKMTRSPGRMSFRPRSSSSSSFVFPSSALPVAVPVFVDVEAAVASMKLNDDDEDFDALANFSTVPRELPPPPDRSSIHYPGFDIYCDPHLYVERPRGVSSLASKAETILNDADADKENTEVTPRLQIKRSVPRSPVKPTRAEDAITEAIKQPVFAAAPPSPSKPKTARLMDVDAESIKKPVFAVKSMLPVPPTPRKGLSTNANTILQRTPTRPSPKLDGSKGSPSRSTTKRLNVPSDDGENDWLPEPIKKRRRRAVSVSDEMNVD